MTSINSAASQLVRTNTAAPKPQDDTKDTQKTKSNADGIVVNDHAGARTAMRIGGGLAAVGGLIGAGVTASRMGGLKGGALGVGIAGVVVGAGLIAGSFAGGLQPKTLPFAQSGLPSFDTAVKNARQAGDDMAVFKQSDTSFALVDFASRDFDNEDTSSIDLGNKKIAWSGLVTKDGDLLTPTGTAESYTNTGRADPKAIKLAGLTAADAPKLAGERIGTTDQHGAASLGKVVGDAKGYATHGEAAVAAYSTPGATAIVQLGGRFVLMDTKLPSGARVTDLSARGTGVDPVSGLKVQEDKKIFGADKPGEQLTFTGRSTPFNVKEPLGTTVGGNAISRHIATGGFESLVSGIRKDTSLIDSVFAGRTGGAVVLKSKDPDGSVAYNRYDTAVGRGSRGNLDQQLSSTVARLERNDSTRHEYSQTGRTEYDATIYRTDYARSDADLSVSGKGTTELRTTGWVFKNRSVDYGRTQTLRSEIRSERIREEQRQRAAEEQRRREAEEARNYPPGGVSNGDTPSIPGGGVSHGDEPRSGGSGSSGGYPGGGVSGGDSSNSGSSGGYSGSGVSSGDD